uniref:ATP synthase F0 subunit 8 n=1 Tax=Babylonia borneensis TaxID=619961 RepID=A0A1L2BH84_9CAEN|nr:ATP synthase F0 subunit 8 [Babylonia borneensis]
MPQLSPLNWILLFTLFWTAVLTLSVLIWWTKKIFFQSETSKHSHLEENKWNW